MGLVNKILLKINSKCSNEFQYFYLLQASGSISKKKPGKGGLFEPSNEVKLSVQEAVLSCFWKKSHLHETLNLACDDIVSKKEK